VTINSPLDGSVTSTGTWASDVWAASTERLSDYYFFLVE